MVAAPAVGRWKSPLQRLDQHSPEQLRGTFGGELCIVVGSHVRSPSHRSEVEALAACVHRDAFVPGVVATGVVVGEEDVAAEPSADAAQPDPAGGHALTASKDGRQEMVGVDAAERRL